MLTSSLWGYSCDRNGEVIEELLDLKNYVCLNDESDTRVDVRTGIESAIDLTLVSDSLAGLCSWEVMKLTTIGSDHYPIKTAVRLSIERQVTGGVKRWCFSEDNWDVFKVLSEQEFQKVDMNVGVDDLNDSICKAILVAASRVIKRKGGSGKRKIVPWWTTECDKVIKCHNKAFKKLKGNLRVSGFHRSVLWVCADIYS